MKFVGNFKKTFSYVVDNHNVYYNFTRNVLLGSRFAIIWNCGCGKIKFPTCGKFNYLPIEANSFT